MNNGDDIEVRTEKYIGFDNQLHKVWNLVFPEPIIYSESEACLTEGEYASIGRYYSKPVTIFSFKDREVLTLSHASAKIRCGRFDSRWRIQSPEVYPLFDINNEMIGYVDHGETYYSNEWLLSNHKYIEYIRRRWDILSTLMYIMAYTILILINWK